MNIIKADEFRVPRCPYLGLHDDRSTSLAYPSTWNYCYHATPPAPVVVSHQGEVCLCSSFANCAVYQTGTTDPLPASLRGKPGRALGRQGPSGARFIVPVLSILLTLAGLFLFRLPAIQGSDSALSLDSLSQFFSAHPLLQDLPWEQRAATNTATESALLAGEATPPVQEPAVLPSETRVHAGDPRTGPGDLASSTSAPAGSHTVTIMPEGTCGHALDVPFGRTPRLVLHRVLSGENLTLYAEQYHTSIAAILAVNSHLPMPVWEDWIIIIPVETGDRSPRVPPFEPYQAIGASLSLEELAEQLNTDAQSLYKYNAFGKDCKVFSGWLVVPRER